MIRQTLVLPPAHSPITFFSLSESFSDEGPDGRISLCSDGAAVLAAILPGVFLFWHRSSFGSNSFRSVLAVALQQFWRQFPQECPCSGMAAAMAPLPSGEFPLRQHSPLKEVPSLMAAVSFNMRCHRFLW